MTDLRRGVGHLRRDGDPPDLGGASLWVRQIHEWIDDLRRLWRVTPNPRTYLSAARAVTRYHLGHAFSPLNSDRRVRMSAVVNGLRRDMTLRLNGSDIHVYREIFLHDALSNIARATDLAAVRTVVDLGSNVGLATMYLSCWAPDARFWCVEPADGNNDLARANAIGNGVDADFTTVAVAANSGQVEFYPNAWWASSTTVPVVEQARTSRPERFEHALQRPAVQVPATSIGDYLAAHDIRQVDLMKIDIEGAEAEVFRGDCTWLDSVSLLAIEMHDKYIDPAPVREALELHGMRALPGSGPLELFRR